MQITLDIPEDLVARLGPSQLHLAQALEIGLNKLEDRPQEGFTGFSDILEFLADLPTPEAILALRPSENLQNQIDRLSEKYQAQDLTAQEQELWQQYEYLEHIVRMAKGKAYAKLNPPQIA
jgi:hypothetical protein